MKSRHQRLWGIALGLLLLCGALFFVLNAFQSNLVFFFTPTQVAAGEAPKEGHFRVGGLVKEGSIQRDGMAVAFVAGLLVDVHQAGLLGQHALAYVVLSYLAIMVHRRLRWFSEMDQALQVFPLFALAHAVEVLLSLMVGGGFPGWWVLLAPVAEALLWTPVSLLLLAPQRRAPDPDENRPL
jgi:hypothetical protein